MANNFDFDAELEHCANHDTDLIRHGAFKMTSALKSNHPFNDGQLVQICKQINSLVTSKNHDGKERNEAVKAAGIAMLQSFVARAEVAQYRSIMEALTTKFHELANKMVDLPPEEIKTENDKEKQKIMVKLMDLYSLGLEHIVEECTEESSEEVFGFLSNSLLEILGDRSLRVEDNTATVLSYKVLSKMLKSRGETMETPRLRAIVDICLKDLHTPLQRSSITCLGSVCAHLDDGNLQYLTSTLLEQIQKKKSFDVNISVEAISIIASRCGHRLGGSLKIIIPLFLGFIGDVDMSDDEQSSVKTCTLRENMCVALTKFAERCPVEVSNIGGEGDYMEVVLNKMFELMAFDPIYGDADDDDSDDDDDNSEKDDDDSDEDDSDEDDSDDDDDDDDDDDYDDDLSDDHTWRVRRAALRVISAFIRSRPEMLSTMYRRCVVAPDEDENSPGPLIARLSEHHQGVRIEVISTVRELFKRSSLRHRALLSARSGQDDGQDDGGMEEVFRSLQRSSASRAHKLLRQRSDHRVLSDRSDAIMKAVEKVLSDKKIAKNSSIVAELFLMLREWLVALGGQMPNVGQWVTTTQSIDRLVPRIVQSLTESKIDVKTRGTALEFLISLADSHGCDALRYEEGTKEYQLLVDGVTACSEADGYAIRCQTLRLLRSMVLRSKKEKEKQPMLHDLTFVQTICTTLIKHPEGVVKRCAVDTLSSLLEMGSTDAGVWSELNSALSSDSTGTTAMRAISRILLSDSSSSMDSVSANGGVSSLTKLLSKSGTSRGTKSSALSCVADIVAACAPGGRGEGHLALEQQQQQQVLIVATNSIDVNDPHVSGIALRCLDSLLCSFASKSKSSFLDEWNKSLREKIVGLSGCLEEGEPLDFFCTFLRCISDMSEIDPIGLINSFLKRSSERNDGMTTNSMIAVSRCIQCLCSRDASVLKTTVRIFTALLSDPGKDGIMRTQLALYGLGEIGSRTNIEPYLSEKEKSGIESMFSVKEGELREASAWCLGSASTCSTDVLLPRILAFARAGQGSSTTTALSCLRRALRLVSANSDDLDRVTELDMSPHVHDILSTLRLHVFPNGSDGGASKSDGANQSEESSTNHDVAVATECWGLLSTLPGIGYGVLSEEWTCVYDRMKGRKKYVKRVGEGEGEGETSFDRPPSDKKVPSVPLISELVTTLESDAAPPSHRCNAVVALSHVVSLLGSRRERTSTSDIVVEDVDDLRTTSEISGQNQSESAPGRLRDILSGVLERIVQLSSMSTVAAGGEGKESSGVEGDLKTGEASLRLIGGLLRHHKSLLSGRQLHERIVPMLLERMKTLMEVEVNYGAFKMKDDRALPMRLAAFDCMETILGLLGGKMEKKSLDELMDVLTASVPKMGADGKPKVLKKTGKIQLESLGVKDANEVVRIVTYRMLVSMCDIDPQSILHRMDHMCHAMNMKDLKVTLKKTTKILELNGDTRDEPIKAAVRLLRVLSRVQGVEETSLMQTHMSKWVCDGQPQLKQLWDATE